MQPYSIRVKLCDQPLDAFDLRWVSRRNQRLEVALNPFVYFYTRLAHALMLRLFPVRQKEASRDFKRVHFIWKGASTGEESSRRERKMEGPGGIGSRALLRDQHGGWGAWDWPRALP
jgi:hypothetical protein